MTDALLDIVLKTKFELLLESSTIIREAHNQHTTIDLIFVSERIQSMMRRCVMRIDLHQDSNHLSIVIELCLSTIHAQTSSRRLWKKMNTEALNAYLRVHLLDEHTLNSEEVIDIRITKITRTLQEAIENFTLWARSSNRANDFWNQNCTNVVTETRRLRSVWRTQSTHEVWDDYQSYSSHKNKIIKKAKRSHFRTQLHELSKTSKSIWRFVKWVRIESQLLKKFSQFSSLKRSENVDLTTSFEEKIELLRDKFFPSSSQTDVSDISEFFISAAVSSNPHIFSDEVKQTIRRVKADKASDESEILNKILQTGLEELISSLTSLFNACVILNYHSRQFKKARTIVLRKSKKSDYIDSKAYRLIALLDIMSKALELIMIKRLSDIVEAHKMLSDAQMRARRERFVISALKLLMKQIHAV